MTDNEIIKALEACKEADECAVCPLRHEKTCFEQLSTTTLDLIARQKAEIERLKEPLQKLSEIGYCHNFQLERSDLVKWIYDVCDVVKVAKK